MADYLIQETTLDAIADAINAKTGGSSAMTPAQMVTEIGNISGGDGPEEVTLVNNMPLYSVRETIQTASGMTNFFCVSLDTEPESGYFLYGGIYIPSMRGGIINTTMRRTTAGQTGQATWDSGSSEVPAGSKFNVWGIANYA